jgi:aspartate 1-decarboxylase
MWCLPQVLTFFTRLSNVAVQVNNASAGSGFATVLANNAGGFIVSDGTNVRLSNLGNQLVTSTYVIVGSEQAAPGTYNT